MVTFSVALDTEATKALYGGEVYEWKNSADEMNDENFEDHMPESRGMYIISIGDVNQTDTDAPRSGATIQRVDQDDMIDRVQQTADNL